MTMNKLYVSDDCFISVENHNQLVLQTETKFALINSSVRLDYASRKRFLEYNRFFKIGNQTLLYVSPGNVVYKMDLKQIEIQKTSIEGKCYINVYQLDDQTIMMHDSHTVWVVTPKGILKNDHHDETMITFYPLNAQSYYYSLNAQ